MSLASKLLLFGFLVLVSQAAGGRPYDVLISEVVSGDTIKTSTGETIRIYGVSCPERMQDLASEATDFTRKLVIYKTVTVNPKKKDVDGVLMAEVLLDRAGKKENLAHLILYNGYGMRDRTATHDRVLLRIQKEAEKNKTGIWKNPNPVPPWEAELKTQQDLFEPGEESLIGSPLSKKEPLSDVEQKEVWKAICWVRDQATHEAIVRFPNPEDTLKFQRLEKELGEAFMKDLQDYFWVDKFEIEDIEKAASTEGWEEPEPGRYDNITDFKRTKRVSSRENGPEGGYIDAEASSSSDCREFLTYTDTVWITDFGNKFHKIGSQYLIHNAHPVTVKIALDSGYIPSEESFPCGIRLPDTQAILDPTGKASIGSGVLKMQHKTFDRQPKMIPQQIDDQNRIIKDYLDGLDKNHGNE